MKKTMMILKLTLAISASLLLSACSYLNLLPRADVVMELTTDGTELGKTQITVQVTRIITREDGVPDVVSYAFARVPMQLRAYAKPGSTSLDITGYSVDYFYAGGSQIATSTGQSYRGSVSLYVPDGLRCNHEPTPGDAEDCNINTVDEAGAIDSRYERGAEVQSNFFHPLSEDMISTLFFGTESRVGSYASITIEGEDANKGYFSKFFSPVTIVFEAQEDIIQTR